MVGPAFRATLARVPPAERDAWVDRLLGLDPIPEDDPALPRGCVPYLPCPVAAILAAAEQAEVTAADVVVDIGAGVGRAAAVMHLLTGASTIGLEIQPTLVRAARRLVQRLPALRLAVLEGDAAHLAGALTRGSVFFLYCPFSGERLARLLDDLEAIARRRPIRICCVDLPLPPRAWLALATPQASDVALYRSTLHAGAAAGAG